MEKRKLVSVEPAINVYTKEEYIKRISLLKDLATLFQFDVIDGEFARPMNFNEPKIVKSVLKSEQIDLHFMVMDIKKEIDKWLSVRPRRIIIQSEHPDDLTFFLKEIKKTGTEVGVAIAHFTPIEHIYSYVKSCDHILVLGVAPGRSGQKMAVNTLERIIFLRNKFPKLSIGVDGGVEFKDIPKLIDLGVENIVIGSAIFTDNVRQNFLRIKEICDVSGGNKK